MSIEPRSHTSKYDLRSTIRQSVLNFSPTGNLVAQQPSGPTLQDRDQLVLVAKETKSVLPGLLNVRSDARPDGFLCQKDDVSPLDQTYCPKLPKIKVRVINSDTIDAALELTRDPLGKPVCVLNMADGRHAGGGFLKGALAQEESLCYRTSLHFTLKLRHYPLPDKAAIYSPTVLVIRDSLSNSHKLLDSTDPTQLPLISVVSAAAVYKPSLKANPHENSDDLYAKSTDRDLMAEKMRIILRTAIRNRHRKIVLGAFGCGVFRNPIKAACHLWEQVLQEQEFSGGWWEEVVFAVLSGPGSKTFHIIHRNLDGLMV